MNTKGKFQPVIECRSVDGITGNTHWEYKLACGAVGRKPKQRRGQRIAKPAPMRVMCRCDKCTQEAQG